MPPTMTGALSVAEAHARLVALVRPLPAEVVPLADAAGRTLAADIVAARSQPPVPVSAMDGYALRATDLAAGAALRVIGTAAAGSRFDGRVGPGEAVRIFTGAPIPGGADFVLLQEDATREGDVVRVSGDPGSNPSIRPAGGDFSAGDRIAAPCHLTPARIALAAAMNAARVRVARQPEIALLPTGDELVPPGGEPTPDQIVSSNGHGLKALLDAAGARTRLLPIAGDRAESLAAGLGLTAGADLVVTIGGASAGDLDLVRAGATGRDLTVQRIAMRPGKPLLAGLLDDGRPFVGLPGNPVSALVTARLFLVPMIERMLGLPGDPPPRLPGRLAVALGPNGPRTHFLRARADAGPDGRFDCTAFANQDSSLLSVLADANALVVRPPHDPAREAGAEVDFLWIK